jgi:peptide/nickel transport system ATP-binding protein
MADPVLRIRDLRVELGPRKARKEILHGISFDVEAGRVMGIAGESGSGKSMTGLAIMRLLPAQGTIAGSIEFQGRKLPELSEKDMQKIRGAQISVIQQDPTASLHPMLSVERQLTDHYRSHRKSTRDQARARALELLRRVQVPNPEDALKKYPHQFSGGQLQRIAIASALMCEPDLLIADEPTTALDVTVQAGVLRLIRSLCDEMGLGVMFITHDLGVLSAISDSITVMRDGVVVEQGTCEQILTDPHSAYTQSLIDALPEKRVDGQVEQ